MPYAKRRFKLSAPLEEKICTTFLDCLDGDEKQVMMYRMGFGIDHGMGYKEIGDLLGVTAQRIFFVEEEAMKRISKACRQQRIDHTQFKQKTKIGTLNLTSRIHNTLIGSGIIYVEQLCQYTMEDLTLIPGLGKSARNEIAKRLRGRDLSLKKSDPLDGVSMTASAS